MARLAAAALLGLPLGGCDGEPAAPPEPPQAAPPTDPPPALPARPVAMRIDGSEVAFPPALLTIERGEASIDLRLFSDDPREAINADYAGNGFYFAMSLPADAPLDGAVWRREAPQFDRPESPDGIFLDGHRRHLQPIELTAAFAGDEASPTIILSGYAVEPRGGAGDAPRIAISATLHPQVIAGEP